MAATPGIQLDKILAKYDRVVASSESEALARIESVLDASYKRLESELRRKWEKYSAESQPNLLGAQRSLLLLQEVKQYLQMFRPEDASTIEQAFQELLTTSTESGISMSDELMGAIAGKSFVKSTVSVNLNSVKFQAEEGRRRLSKHSDDFASRASAIVEMSLVQGWGIGRASSLLRKELGTTKGKAEQIVRTESLSSLNRASVQNYNENGLSQVEFYATSDNRLCFYCAARSGHVYEIGKISVPLHPSCRCFLAPYSPDWRELGLIDEDWLKRNRDRAIEEAGGINNGVAPFEKAAGLIEPPKPLWTVADIGKTPSPSVKPLNVEFDFEEAGLPLSKPGVHDALIEKGMRALEKLGDGTIDKISNSLFVRPPELIDLILEREELFDRLYKMLDENDDEDDEFTSGTDEINEQIAELGAKIYEQEQLVKKQPIAIMERLRDSLIQRSVQSATQAAIVKIDIQKSVEAEIPIENARSLISEFASVTNGAGLNLLKRVILDDDRAYADDRDGTLNIGRNEEFERRRVVFHELGHFVEFEVSGLRESAESWIKARAEGGKEKLNVLAPNSSYGDHESAFPDRFWDVYVGKVYPDGYTEAISMGLENFIDPQMMAEFYRKDPEHFFLVLGAIADD